MFIRALLRPLGIIRRQDAYPESGLLAKSMLSREMSCALPIGTRMALAGSFMFATTLALAPLQLLPSKLEVARKARSQRIAGVNRDDVVGQERRN
jgi:hypothetical protein